jgi:hypothetical protein
MPASRKLILASINVCIVFGLAFGYRDNRIDKYSLLAVGGISLLVLNGMFFAIRFSEPTLPNAQIKRLNRYVVGPIVLLAGLVIATELFCGK